MTKLSLIALFFTLNSFGQSAALLENKWNKLVKANNFDKEKQSYCFKKDNQVFGQNIDLKVRPASVSKIYTTYWALETLTKHHQFITKFKLAGNDLYITGGNDPFFVTENLFVIITHLNTLGIKSLDHIYFDENFFLNWSDSPKSISSNLISILNTKNYSSHLKKILNETITFSKKFGNVPNIFIDELSVNKAMKSNTIKNNFDYEFSFVSSPISHHLKQMNIYSTNFYADKIFDYMGGRSSFHNFIDRNLNTTEQDIRFETGSGLGENYTTCGVTLKMLENLAQTLFSNNLNVQDILSVPGSDQGTLRNRFKDKGYNKHLAAKTGTLRHTSTLSGYMFSEEPTLFAIFNHTYKSDLARMVQNDFIMTAIDSFSDTKEINYKTADYISIRFTHIE